MSQCPYCGVRREDMPKHLRATSSCMEQHTADRKAELNDILRKHRPETDNVKPKDVQAPMENGS